MLRSAVHRSASQNAHAQSSMELLGTAERWKASIQSHFGRVSVRHWRQLHGDVACVLLGLKPALLVDCVPAIARALQRLLADVFVVTPPTVTSSPATPGQCGLCIVEVGQDVLLVNRDALQQWRGGTDPSTSNDNGLETQFVDVTRGKGPPSIVAKEQRQVLETELKAWQSSLETKLAAWLVEEQSRSGCDREGPTRDQSGCHVLLVTDLNVNGACPINPCTLFGWLLGYPIVYWFEGDGGHCLDWEELVCYTAEVHCTGGAAAASQQPRPLDRVSEALCICYLS